MVPDLRNVSKLICKYNWAAKHPIQIMTKVKFDKLLVSIFQILKTIWDICAIPTNKLGFQLSKILARSCWHGNTLCWQPTLFSFSIFVSLKLIPIVTKSIKDNPDCPAVSTRTEREGEREETRCYLSVIGRAINLGKEALILTTWKMVGLEDGLLPQHGSSPAIKHVFRFHLNVILFRDPSCLCLQRARRGARGHHCLSRLLHPVKRERETEHLEKCLRLASEAK